MFVGGGKGAVRGGGACVLGRGRGQGGEAWHVCFGGGCYEKDEEP